MAPLILHRKDTESVLAVPGWFLTEYMPEANGDFVKVYLFLLMTATRSEANLSVSRIADELFCTESDVVRAFKYWDRKGLLQMTLDADGQPCELAFVTPGSTVTTHTVPAPPPAPVAVTAAPANTPVESVPSVPAAVDHSNQHRSMESFASDPEFQMLLRIIEMYLARTLTASDVERIEGWYRDTNKNFELLDYLVQYCVDKDKTSFSYMDKVLLNWQSNGITTAEEAISLSQSQFEDGRVFLKIFGVTNRGLSTKEAEKIQYWKHRLGVSMDLIFEAAERTMAATGMPALEYMESILTKWADANITTLDGVREQDAKYRAAREHAKNSGGTSRSRSSGVNPTAAPNRFHNFDQRSYDYQEWEKELLAPYQQDAVPHTGSSADDWDTLLAAYRKEKN